MTANTGNNVMNFADFFEDKQTKQAQEAAHNLAWMNTKLCAPLVIKQIMDECNSVDEDSIYALHDMISDFEIDTALLAICSGALQIIRSLRTSNPSAHVLAMECERIICTYGEEWTTQNMTGETDHDYLMSILRDLPEEFESVCELMQIAMDQIEEPAAFDLLQVLEIQGSAHMAVADEFVAVMDLDEKEEAAQQVAPVVTVQHVGDNVVAFPGNI